MVLAIFLYLRFDKPFRLFILTNILFGIGFYMYVSATSYWLPSFHLRELDIVFNRLSLLLILPPLLVLTFFRKIPFIKYWNRPEWDETIHFPFIWSGFHQTKVKHFLTIALTINILTFLPFVFWKGWLFIQDVWLVAILFSITNATLEEIIWRGVLLSRFSEQLGDKWAVIITSLAFGLQHYSLGFPWNVCIAFSFGGFFYGGITVKSKSIMPSLLWHITINILMVLSGLIL